MAQANKTVSGVLNALSPNVLSSSPSKDSRKRKTLKVEQKVEPNLEPKIEPNLESKKEPKKELDGEPSGSGVGSHKDDSRQSNEDSRDGSEFVTAEMIAVEQKLKKQLEMDQRRRERLAEAQANAVTEEELTTTRYNRLMHLLGRSTFYSQFMKDKLDEMKNKKTAANKTLPRNNKPATTRMAASQPSSRPKRLKHTDAYNIAELVDTLEVLDSSDEDDEPLGRSLAKPKTASLPAATADSADTYVNSMGFTVPALQPPLFEGGAMRDYQIDGLEWLKILDSNSVSGILGDEMGLGKTIQVIALIAHLIGVKTPGPFLIIAPLSTIPNWMSEFQRFAPQIPVLLLHGNAEARRRIINQFSKPHFVGKNSVRPVVITTFQIPMVEIKFFMAKKWRYLIVDEGHRLKNHNSQLSTQLRCYNSVNRLILTGTPLQNNLTELWALLNFLLPEIFNDLASFESWFNCTGLMVKGAEDRILAKEQEHKILSTMHQILSPFLLRRTKADVSLDLPPKKEVLVFCPLTTLQQRLYSAVLDKSIERLHRKQEELSRDFYDCRPKRRCVKRREGRSYADIPDKSERKEGAKSRGESDSDSDDFENWSDVGRERLDVVRIVDERDPNFRFHIKMQMPEMLLRHIVNHPYLVQMPLDPRTAMPRIDEDLVTNSGKMLVLDAMLTKLKQRGHKVLLFSGFTMVLDLMADFMEMRDYEYCTLDGRMSLEDRQTQIRRFNLQPEVFVFLISTRAGGLGINLTAADTVITYDSDWNPQVDLQAQDRCHRIGQTRPVVVYRFITKGTIDQVIIERASAKRKLERMIIQPGAFKLGAKAGGQAPAIDLAELRSLLASSPLSAAMHANGFVFDDVELDKLLDRSDMV